MNITHNPERQKAIDRWTEEIRTSRASLDEARKASLLLDDSAMVDKALGRYVRTVASKGWIFR